MKKDSDQYAKPEQLRKQLLSCLLQICNSKQLSFDEIGELTGFKPVTVRRILEGRFSPNLDQLLLLCLAANCELTIKKGAEFFLQDSSSSS